MPPGEWLHRERLRLAQRLLERTDDPIEVVARRAGYDAAVTMRAQFAARLQTSPRAYRADVPRLTGCGRGPLSQAAGSSARRSSSVSASAASLSVR